MAEKTQAMAGLWLGCEPIASGRLMLQQPKLAAEGGLLTRSFSDLALLVPCQEREDSSIRCFSAERSMASNISLIISAT